MKYTLPISGICSALLMSLAFSGCTLFSSDSQPEPLFMLEVENDVVGQDESFEVVLTARNPSQKSITIQTSCKEFALLFVYKGNERKDFAGDNNVCLRKINHYEIAPQSELTLTWVQTATVMSWNPETESADTASAEPGRYTIQARVNATHLNDSEYGVDYIERELIVIE